MLFNSYERHAAAGDVRSLPRHPKLRKMVSSAASVHKSYTAK